MRLQTNFSIPLQGLSFFPLLESQVPFKIISKWVTRLSENGKILKTIKCLYYKVYFTI